MERRTYYFILSSVLLLAVIMGSYAVYGAIGCTNPDLLRCTGDITPPRVFVSNTPTTGITTTTPVTLTATVSDAGGLDSVYVSVGLNLKKTCTFLNGELSGTCSTTPSTYAAGTYSYLAEVYDLAGNYNSASGSFTVAASSQTCGNGVKEGTEQCDGAQLGGATCTSLGYTGGTLSCSSTCTFNTAACTTTASNTMTCTPGTLSFSMGQGTPPPAAQTYQVTPSSAFQWAVSSYDNTAISTTPALSVIQTGTQTVSVSVKSGLAQGNYTTTINNLQNGGGASCSVGVNVTVNPTTGRCGNGFLEPPEQCDAGGQNGVVCSPTYGSTCTYCSTTCQNVTVLGPRCGDGVCNSGETPATCAADCVQPALCGNGQVDAGEQCDTSVPPGVTCQTLGFGGGTPSCYSPGSANQCTFNTANCWQGTLDTADCSQITGWACDAANYTKPVSAQIYFDNDGSSSANLIASAVAGSTRSDVAAQCGGNAAHGFAVATPALLKDNVQHTIRAFAFKQSGTRYELSNSSRNITCAPPTTCGNGQLDAGEVCDGTNLNGKNCASQGYTCGALSCSGSCSFDVAACFTTNLQTDNFNCGACGNVCPAGKTCQSGSCGIPQTCGNGVREGSEECDGSDFSTITCKSRGYFCGTLKCTSLCKIDETSCTFPALSNDVNNCGSCGNTCSQSEFCQLGVCTLIPDTTPPTVNVTLTPSTGIEPDKDLAIDTSATDASGVGEIRITVDGTTKICTLSGTKITDVCSLTGRFSVGTHTYSISALDKKGNRNDTSAKTFTVADLTPPTLTLTSPPSQVSTITRVMIAAAGDDISGIDTTQIFIDGRLNISQHAPGYTTTIYFGQGIHTYYAVVNDTYGNTRQSQTFTLNVTKAIVCGDSVIEGTEQCEAGNFNGLNCTSKGFTCGSLTCTMGSCSIDSSGCFNTNLNSDNDNCGACGVQCSASQKCSQGRCTISNPGDETFANGNCFDGVDNDGDGEVDVAGPPKGDSGCAVGIRDISLNQTVARIGTTVLLGCEYPFANLRSAQAFIDGVPCNLTGWVASSAGIPSVADFVCSINSSGSKLLKCGINRAISYQAGVDKNITLRVPTADESRPILSVYHFAGAGINIFTNTSVLKINATALDSDGLTLVLVKVDGVERRSCEGDYPDEPSKNARIECIYGSRYAVGTHQYSIDATDTGGAISTFNGNFTILTAAAADLLAQQNAANQTNETVPASGLPDLGVTDLTLKDGAAVIDTPATIKVAIRNDGDTSAVDGLLDVRINNISFNKISLPPLKPGSSIFLDVQWTPSAAGNYVIRAIVGHTNATLESNAANNEKSMIVVVTKPQATQPSGDQTPAPAPVSTPSVSVSRILKSLDDLNQKIKTSKKQVDVLQTFYLSIDKKKAAAYLAASEILDDNVNRMASLRDTVSNNADRPLWIKDYVKSKLADIKKSLQDANSMLATV